jgi:hypothetical protein
MVVARWRLLTTSKQQKKNRLLIIVIFCMTIIPFLIAALIFLESGEQNALGIFSSSTISHDHFFHIPFNQR